MAVSVSSANRVASRGFSRDGIVGSQRSPERPYLDYFLKKNFASCVLYSGIYISPAMMQTQVVVNKLNSCNFLELRMDNLFRVYPCAQQGRVVVIGHPMGSTDHIRVSNGAPKLEQQRIMHGILLSQQGFVNCKFVLVFSLSQKYELMHTVTYFASTVVVPAKNVPTLFGASTPTGALSVF